ncbi:BamA/TamA family outer membrane protein [Vibrio sp. 10N.247.311.51]|uniref:BamA/TamA family outer membrane protein n=1 Tax=Vibrio sp. 10N.247.311.51 TaxID=3229996 RepID=UPI003550344D
MNSTSISLCSVTVALFSAGALAEPIEPLFETPEYLKHTWVDDVLDVFGADGEFDESKTIDMSYLPTAYYTPEKKFGVGLLMVGLYHTDGADKSAQPSSLVVNSFVSQNKSYGVSIENMTYFNQGKQSLLLDVDLHNEASVYYGKGITAGDKDNNKHEFDEVLYSFKPTWMTALGPHYYLGVGGDITYAKAEKLENVVNDSSSTPFYELPSGTSAGVVLSSMYDSRDYRLNASDGWLLQLDAGLYQNFESDKTYSLYDLDVANYINLNPIPGLVAWQVQGLFSEGDVPWYAMPDLGGSSAMRGYIKGRYRDEHMLMGQVEYRLPIVQRLGMVFWGAAGSVAPSVSELNEDILTSVGTGFRFRIKDKINLRADVGVGQNETAFYLNVNEVF